MKKQLKAVRKTARAKKEGDRPYAKALGWVLEKRQADTAALREQTRVNQIGHDHRCLAAIEKLPAHLKAALLDGSFARLTMDERIKVADLNFATGITPITNLKWAAFILRRCGLTCEVEYINNDELALFAVRKASQ